MKNKFIFLLLGLLLISFASASYEFDNIGQYDEETKTIIIKNSVLGISWLDLGEIGGARLNTPLDYHVPVGYQKVAEFDLWAYEDYNDVLKNLEFYDKNYREWDKHKFNRDFDIKYKTTKNIQSPTFEEYCYFNSTINGESCVWVENGTVSIEVEDWVKLTPASLKKNDILTIGIFTDVKMNDNVEWILELYGVRVKQWATFIQSSGTTTIDGNYTVQTFTSNGTFNLTGDDINVSILVVAGGGAGGGGGGGGGAGGLTYDGSFIVSAGDYSVVVGSGGSASGSIQTTGGNGGTSSFSTISTTGGGGGGGQDDDGIDGGSGGGAGFSGAGGQVGGDGVVGQGNDGGLNFQDNPFGSGGGGGAGAAGDNADTNKGGDGGDGLSYSINGSSIYYAGGGGGGSNSASSSSGGTGGGGDGGNSPTTGSPNSGGGGGGSVGNNLAKDGGSGIIIIRYLTPEIITVTLISPADNANLTSSNIDFVAIVTDEQQVDNVTLYIDGVANETNSSGFNGNYTFSKVISDGSHNWSILAWSNQSLSSQSETRVFTVDSILPQITAESPVGTLNNNIIGNNETLNATFTDTRLDSCWYNYNGTNVTIDGCQSGVKNSTNFILEENNFNMTIYANDTFGNLNSTFISWSYKLLEINQTYNNETTEGTTETFEANIKLGSGLTIAATALIYNGTTNIGSSSLSGEITTLEAEALIPNVNSDINISFYWTIILSDSSIINLSIQNQSVLSLSLDNCSSFTNLLFNFTQLDEEMQNQLSNTTKEIAINIFDKDRITTVINLSDEYLTNPTLICLNSNLTEGSDYSLDAIIRYEATGYTNEYYNIVDLELTKETETQKISLYNLNESDSTEFQLTFTGEDFVPVENALVFVERQYIVENTFKTVELPKTDSNGQTVLHLVRNEIIYNIIVMKDKVVLGRFENLIAFCDDFSIGNCKIVLNAIGEDAGVPNYDEELGILFDSEPTYNDTTKIVSFSFTSVDGTSKAIVMDVERRDVFGNTSVCSNILVSTSGTVSCNVGNISDSSLVTIISVDGTESLFSQVEVDTVAYGSIGYVVLFFLTLAMMLYLGDSKNGIIISLLIGYIVAIAMGFMIGGIIGIGSSGIWMISLAVAALWQINKNKGK